MLRPITRTIGASVAFPPTNPIGRGNLAGLGHTAYQHIGDAAPGDDGNYVFAATGDVASTARSWLGRAIMGAAAYHGYKRTGSVGWAIGWAVLAGFSPVITGGVAVAQGFGKRKAG